MPESRCPSRGPNFVERFPKGCNRVRRKAERRERTGFANRLVRRELSDEIGKRAAAVVKADGITTPTPIAEIVFAGRGRVVAGRCSETEHPLSGKLAAY